MKRNSPVALSVFGGLLLAFSAYGQDTNPEKAGRPRTVTPTTRATQSPSTTAVPQQQPTVAPKINPSLPGTQTMPAITQRTSAPKINPSLPGTETAPGTQIAPGTTQIFLTPVMLQSRISEAQRLLKSRPRTTASTPSIQFVTIAALEPEGGKIHLLTVSKETFLTKGAELSITTSLGSPVTLRIVRANGVNTAMTMFTADNKFLMPLTIEYPIEHNGLFKEMAYYTSAHPALLSNDLTKAGQTYVRSMLDLAAKRLREKGEIISPNLVDIAERLCIVEHTDHDRFRQENRLALFSEIYSLYALNELDTYRYSVSIAGAGGMVQMIPWAYNLVRQRHPGVGLIPDFVVGMRTHSNALQAMLLYMQDTWNEMYSNADIRSALETKQATMPELMAAGYNSNAAKLPAYLRRGGDAWRTLIPRETQMYLQIYKTFESLIPLKSRGEILTASGN